MSEPDDEKKFNEKCEDFLAKIERLDVEIVAEASDKKRLKRNMADIRREFAAYLRDNGKDHYQTDRWKVWALWRVDGVPSQKTKKQASAWMETKNYFGWTGFAPPLRKKVAWALTNNEPVPNGYFGLHVEWTVEVFQRVRHHAEAL